MDERDTPQISQEMINLFDDYTHLSLDRRKFMDNLAKLAGSMSAANGGGGDDVVKRQGAGAGAGG